ncbi:MAG: CoA pyrophosphatase [Acidobacteria bacterium]|nr:CoA pyrophosphatase [Acidobacteriota bacterium]
MAPWSFDDVAAALGERIGSLPGLPAQMAMAPQPRHGWKPGFAPEGSRPAAALLVLYPVNGAATLLLTKRTSHLPQHKGQVSLPGGALDAGETVEEAALREAHEEIGLPPASVSLIGRLTPIHIPVSGYVLNPVVGTVSSRPGTRREAGEVDRIIEVSVAVLLDRQRHRRTTVVRDGLEIEMPYFDIDGEQVWGATAMVLAEFASLLGVWPEPR